MVDVKAASRMRISKTKMGTELILSNITISGTDKEGKEFSAQTLEKIIISPSEESLMGHTDITMDSEESFIDFLRYDLNNDENGNVIASNKFCTIMIEKTSLSAEDSNIPKDIMEIIKSKLGKESSGLYIIKDLFDAPFKVTIPTRGISFKVGKESVLSLLASKKEEITIMLHTMSSPVPLVTLYL